MTIDPAALRLAAIAFFCVGLALIGVALLVIERSLTRLPPLKDDRTPLERKLFGDRQETQE